MVQSRKDKSEESDDDDGDGSDDDDEKDDDKKNEGNESGGGALLSEAMKVTAAPVGYRGNASELQHMSINSMSDLKTLASSGKYDYFTVDNNGSETEYMVERGKLVEM